jgi:hypothetical protein
MTRIVLAATLILLVSGGSFADNKTAQQKNAAKQAKAALTKSLNEQIHQLREQEKAELKQIDMHFKALIDKVSRQDGSEKQERARLEREEKEAMNRIDERFHYVIHNLEPKQVRHQLDEALKSLRHVHAIISEGNFNYGGNRRAAQIAVAAAERQLKRALEHDTHEERSRAARDLQAAHRDVSKALDFSLKKYGLGNGKPERGEPETRAAANRQLVESLGTIENTHHLLSAVDHEIKDYEVERREYLKKKDEVKRKVHGEFEAKRKQLSEEIHRGPATKKALEQKRDEAKRQIRAQYAAKIKDLEQQIKALK